MADALGRRGPDASAQLVSGACGLAHTRLSIIDIAGSPQPMRFDDCDIAIVYNGETYNYEALGAELGARGRKLRTCGDTEVVLRWLSEEWTAALPRFDAMFALAAWDERRERLLLARDALGEKPLFYATPRPGLLVFGSEPKALLAHPMVDGELNEDALRQALRFRAVYSGASLHRGIRELEPGGFLECSRAGIALGRHFELGQEVESARARVRGNDGDLIASGQKLFEQSVRERLIADVPVGAFLSGGLDSSLIVAAMRAARPSQDIRTFSVGFSGDPHNELRYAEAVASALHTSHQSITVGPEAYLNRLSELSACRDGPVSQPADVAIAEMSRVARQHVKVVLSGEGADEVFGGYPKHGFAGAPWFLRKLIATVGPRRVSSLAAAMGVDGRRSLIAARALAGGSEIDGLVQWFSYLDRAALVELFPGLGWGDDEWALTSGAQDAALADSGPGSALYRMQATDLRTWLPGNMLERGDRMTMAEGLELRPPFLDRELAVFGLALPDHLKVRRGVGKRIVRRWARGRIPGEILTRPKWGFRTPLREWFRGPLEGMLRDYLSERSGLVAAYGDRRRVEQLVEAHRSGEIDASDALWTLLSAAVWYKDVYLERRGGMVDHSRALVPS